ncbi:protein piccolo isoform X4 [Lepisosteus oculatus]|uniref:protein piccolo isoform X4 n=1 Tax=Lepisosteus oculatus TaxID=7918 RepID=UPI003720622F
MGNEASLEGGEGGLSGLQEGVAGDGKGGFIQIPAGMEADLSQLSEEERKQIAAVMSRAQGLPPGNTKEHPLQRKADVDTYHQPRQPGKPPTQGPAGISKSQTVDVFKTEKIPPGRSPSSISLLESRSKPEVKDEQKAAMMPSFLSEGNPLSAMSSVVNKFSLFGDSDEDEAAKKQKSSQQPPAKTPGQQPGKASQQTGPRAAQQQQGSPKPGRQQQGSPRPGAQPQAGAPSGPPQQGPGKPPTAQKGPTPPPGSGKPTPAGSGPQQPVASAAVPPQQGPTKPSAQQQGPPKPSAQQQGPPKPTAQQQGPPKPTAQQQGPPKPTAQQQGPPKPTAQQQGPTKPTAQQQGPPKPTAQQQGPPKAGAQSTVLGPQQQAPPTSGPEQRGPAKPGLRQQGPPASAAQHRGPQQQGSPQSGPGQATQMPGPAKPPSEQPGSGRVQSQQGSLSGSSEGTAPGAEPAEKKSLCPLCKTTELLLHAPDKANYNTCTQCQTVVCSLCGFNPNPHITEVKEWLCLTCQMQRALGMDESAPPVAKPQPQPPKQPSAPGSPQRGKQPEPSKTPEAPTPSAPVKQQPTPDTHQVKPTGVSVALQPQPQKPPAQGSEQPQPSQQENLQKQPGVQKATDQALPSAIAPGAKQPLQGPHTTPVPPKALAQAQDLPQPTRQPPVQDKKPAHPDPKVQPQQKPVGAKPTHPAGEATGRKPSDPAKQPPTQPQEQAKSGQPKTDPSKAGRPPQDPGKSEPQMPKGSPGQPPAKTSQPAPAPPVQQPPKPQEQARRFSLNIGSTTETPKHQPTTPQETVTGKLFGFGSSFFSQASSLISTAVQPADQATPAQPAAAQTAPRETASAQASPKLGPAKKDTKPLVAQKPEQLLPGKGPAPGQEKKPAAVKEDKPRVETPKAAAGHTDPAQAPPLPPKSTQPSCPLCKVELNVGSKDPPNYNTCTECKNTVCNLCGFNPMPHLTEKEWLCLNCQTQRALAGQLGDMGKMPPPVPMSVKPAQPSPTPKTQPPPGKQPSLQKSTSQPFEPPMPKLAEDQQKDPQEAGLTSDPVVGKQDTVSTKQLTRKPSMDKVPLQKPRNGVQALKKEDEKVKHQASKPKAAKADPSPKSDTITKITGISGQLIQKAEESFISLDASKKVEVSSAKALEDKPLSKPQEKKEMGEVGPGAQPLRKPAQVETVKEKPEKEEDRSDTSGSSQQKSPQGLSDTGYSSDGISSSLGEIPNLAPGEEKELLKEPTRKDKVAQESSPTSPSDLAKLESTVLSILEAQASTIEKAGQLKDHYSLYGDEERNQHRARTLPITPESYSSDEEDLADIQEEDEETLEEDTMGESPLRKDSKKTQESKEGGSVRRQRYDSLEDSSESEPSPLLQRKRRLSMGSSSSDDYKQEDSQGSADEEDFIRKQIIEMSADEDASASDDDDYIRTQIKELSAEQKKEQEERRGKGKSISGKAKRLTKKSSASHEDDPGRRHSWHEKEEKGYDETPESKLRETKSQESEELSLSSGGGLRRFKTIELNSTTATPYKEGSDKQNYEEEPELEMESLTDSPEDRSRGEGSSSLHASSFTPGTSPTSVSSLDEDSDSSPSHKKMSGESKQQRKARHRAHGQVLPTIEDSSEEEEMREEEELLREQEKQRELEQQQRKSSSKKSKKDKEELRAQRRRERPKTPPSNLSPIEDASPTEELRQAAEMEELHKSSCSEYSPSIESEPEGFEINPEKILAVQKVYKLPTCVSLYSPTDEQHVSITKDMTDRSLKSADEVYEEMMKKAKMLQSRNETEEMSEKEPLYGGMLIEDYIYESLVEDTYSETVPNTYLVQQEETSKNLVLEPEKKLRSPDEVYEEMMQKKKFLKENELCYSQPSSQTSEQDTILPSHVSEASYVSVSISDTVDLSKDEKKLLDADEAYEELMKRQRTILTPGTSPTQMTPELHDSPELTLIPIEDFTGTTCKQPFVSTHTRSENTATTETSVSSTMYPIPDVKITQHFTLEEDFEEELISTEEDQGLQKAKPSGVPPVDQTADIRQQVPVTCTTSTSTPTVPIILTGPTSVVCEIPLTKTTAVSTSVMPAAPTLPQEATTEYQTTTEMRAAKHSPHITTVVTTTSDSTHSVIVDISSMSKPSSVVTSAGAGPIQETRLSSSKDIPCSSSTSVSSVEAVPSIVPTEVQSAQGHVVISMLSLDSSTDVTPMMREVSVSKPQETVRSQEVTEHVKQKEAVTSSALVTATRVVFESASKTPSLPSSLPSSFSSSASSVAVGVSPLSTVPTYTPVVSTTFSTAIPTTLSKFPPATSATPVTSKAFSLFKTPSQESADLPVMMPPPPPPPPPPPLPPPTLPKPSVYPKKKPSVSSPAVMSSVAPVPVSSAITFAQATITTTGPSTSLKNTVVNASKIPGPPPVPPKPASIPAGLMFSHKTVDGVKPPIAPKPVVSQPPLTTQGPGVTQARPVGPPSTTAMTLNLSFPAECKLASPTSPMSPYSNKSSPRYTNSLHETYVVITLPSEPSTPTESITTQAPIIQALGSPAKQQTQTTTSLSMPFAQYTKSIESQEILGPDKYISSMSHVYSSISTSAQPPVSLSKVVAQVVTTEVQRTTVSVVRERIPTTKAASVAITIPPETTKPKHKENGKMQLSGDVIDLRTLTKLDVEMTDKGMDLSTSDSRRQSFSSDSSGRQISAVQPTVVNLSTGSTPASTLAVVTESITIVTCTATITYSTAGERPLDLGYGMSMPLQLTTSKSFEPVAQITYRPLDSQATSTTSSEVPINLSFGTSTSTGTSKPVTISPASITNGSIDVSTSLDSVQVGAVDLSTAKPVRTMVTVDESTSQVVTAVIEDEEKPVDLTAGRRAVCCDVVYKLPFGRSCTSQQPATTLPEDRFGYRDDHYQYDRSGPYGIRSFGSMKPSMSDTNLAEAGLFLYKSKNSFDYRAGVAEGAVDLTSGRLSSGEVMDYSSKSAGQYAETRQAMSGTGMTIPQYSQARITPTAGTHYGVNSVLRSSNGVVYSSVAAPVPTTFAITTQPGSIFSTTYKDLSGMHTSDTMPSLSTLQNQPLPRSYSFLTTTAAEGEGIINLETNALSATKEGLPVAESDMALAVTTATDSYTDASLEAIASSLEALASPITSAADDAKQQQFQMERELLELEKLKQLRLAEELEWERQEIQRFREQEKLIVQKELEELQTMKHHLLFQQEEERQAHLMMQQETFAQQQLQLEQIQQLQHQLQQQLEEQKIRQIYQYSYDPSGSVSPQTTSEQALLDSQYTGGETGQYWPVKDETSTSSAVTGMELQQNPTWYTVPTEGIAQFIPSLPGSVSEMPLKDADIQEEQQLKKRIPRSHREYDEHGTELSDESRSFKKIVDSGVQTDDEDGVDRSYTGRRKRNKKSVDTSVQTDDEDQDEWDIPTRTRRRSRSSKYSEGSSETGKAKPLSKVSSIAIQTVAEISVQTEPVGTIKRPSVKAHMDAKVEIIKHISAPEKTYKGGSLSCQTETDSDKQAGQYLTSPQKDKKRPTPLEIGYSTHLKADSSLQVAPSPPKSPKVLYSPISPLSPSKSLEFVPYEKPIGDVSPQKMSSTETSKQPPPSPRTMKMMQRSMSDPKPLSPTADESTRTNFQYSDGYSTKGSQSGTPSGTQKKVKRTLPNPPPEEETAGGQSGYTTVGSVSRRRICRTNTMARAKILQDIDRELDLVERESSKLRKKQAELDEEEKEIDAKLRYLEMGINRRKEALLKEREKRERAYLQGVAEERDYMSDSEVSNIRGTRVESQHGLERPRTAPQSEFNQFIPPQTQPEPQYAQPTSPYTQYQYAPPSLPTQAPSQYTQQAHYQQQSLYHQSVSPYQTQSSYSSVPTLSYPQASQQQNYQHPSQMLLMQSKPRQTTLADLEPKITTNYEVIRNQPLMIVPSSTDSTYAVPHLGSKYNSLDLRIGLDERSSMASSPMSSISADSFYADIDHHGPRNYVLIDDIGELTKGTTGLSSTFSIPDKDLSKADRLLRAAEVRRSAEVTDFLGPLQTSSRLHTYGKAEEDPMEDPYELKLLKQQIKQEFRRGTEGLEHLSGLPHYYHGDSSYRHFPKSEKYSISRLTLEKQAAKQLPSSVLYQKQTKHKKALIDPKITKFSPIQESRDLEPDYSSYLPSSTSAVSGLSSRARLLQDDITFGLRKNISEQQKYLGSTLGTNLAQSLGQTLNLGPTMRSSLQDELDKPYPSGSRSRPSSRPSSVYGLDLSIKRDSSSSSLRLKTESEPLDVSYPSPSVRTKPSSLPISQSRGRIPIVAQNSEEESPLSPVGQPMGMTRASGGPLPPICADSRDQFGSSHSLPEVQQHMREDTRTRGYDRDIAFIMDDFQHAMSDSEAGGTSWDLEECDRYKKTFECAKNTLGCSVPQQNYAYHLRREETDWFDKPRDSRLENGHAVDRRQSDRTSHSRQSQHQQGETKPVQYSFPNIRVKLQKDPKDHSVSGSGLGIRIVGGKEIPGNTGDIGAYIAKVLPGGTAEQTGKIVEGMQALEWNGIPLTGKTYEEVQSIVSQPCGEAEICVRLDLNMLSDSENPQLLELHDQTNAGERQRSPGVDPKQLAAELQKVSQQQAPSTVTSATEKGPLTHSGTTSAASSAVPSPGQPGSPSVSKKRHSSKPTEATKSQLHPITGELQLQVNYDKHLGHLILHVLQARNLAPRDNNGYSDPFVRVYLLPGRSAENKRRTKHVQKSLNPEWNQTVIYKNIHLEQLKKKTLELTVWDYDRFSSNDFLGEVLIDLSNTSNLDNTPKWYPLKEESESIDHGRSHSGQSNQASPKPSVIKSRSHGIFPDPSKDMQVPTIEKSHSSPGSSKSSSEGHLRSHGPSRSQSKTSVTQTHLEDAGAAIAAAEAAVQQLRLQPTVHKSGLASHAKKQHRHSITGVLPIQRTQSDNLPSPANESKDTSQLAIRKVMSEGTPKTEARSGHRVTESAASTASSMSSFGSGYSEDSEGSTTVGENNIFPVPRMHEEQTSHSYTKEWGKTIPNGMDKTRGQDPLKQTPLGLGDAEGKTQVMGEIKIALKKEMKTEGEQLIVEILQCRNITYKFKSPDHLPDLYVKLYVINVATQKRVIKKKTRVCRHDREPSFNETFRFNMNPAGHSLQLFLVSNGGKFMKKTLIGEAYVWLDKVDLRKRSVNWHKLLVSSTQSHS